MVVERRQRRQRRNGQPPPLNFGNNREGSRFNVLSKMGTNEELNQEQSVGPFQFGKQSNENMVTDFMKSNEEGNLMAGMLGGLNGAVEKKSVSRSQSKNSKQVAIGSRGMSLGLR